jgi:hypothetical protein
MTISPILPRGEAVPEGFTLPHNTTRTMADVWADDAKHEAAVAVAKASGSRGGMRAKLRFAGYDQTEVQVRKVAGGKE